MNIFQQFGIKEVADVCLYAIELDENDDEIYVPVLYLDTLKVSTVEQTASQTSAQGGLGNPKLITWDYGKEITVTLEDALFTPASQGMTWGGKKGAKNVKLYLRNFFDRGTDSKNPNENLRGAILTIETFSDFFTVPDRWPIYELNSGYCKKNTTGYVGGTSIYCWKVNGNIISNDGKKRVSVNDLILFYREWTQKWYFFNGKGPSLTDESKWWKTQNPDKAYGIYYQYGDEVFEWLKENLSGDNNSKWMQYEDGEEPETYWTEYEEGAKATIEAWTENPPCEEYGRGPIYKVDYGEVGFLTQELFIDGYRSSKCARNIKYSEMTPEEQAAAAQGVYQPYRYNASIDVEYNTNIAPPQEVIYQVDHDLDNVFYLDRIERCKAPSRFCIDTDVNLKHAQYRYLEQYAQTELTVYIDPKTMQPYEPNSYEYYRFNGQRITGNLRVFKPHEIYYKWTRTKAKEYQALGKQIVIDATHFPGTYRLVGETYIRSRKTGQDQRYQFEIPLCKMGSDNHLTLQADGDPTTFTMTLTALRKPDGTMMKLTQYEVIGKKYGPYDSGSTEIVPFTVPVDPTEEQLQEANEPYTRQKVSIQAITKPLGITIETPQNNQTYMLGEDSPTGLSKESGAPTNISEESAEGNIHVKLNYEANTYTSDIWTRQDTLGKEDPLTVETTEVESYTGEKYLDADEYSATLNNI